MTHMKSNRLFALLTLTLFAGFGLATTASASLVGEGAALADDAFAYNTSACRTFENKDQYSESCHVKRFNDGSICIGYYYHEWKKSGETTQRCDYHIDPNLPESVAAVRDSDAGLSAIGPSTCSWEETAKHKRESCIIKVYDDGTICYDYNYYHRKSDGYTSERCELAIEPRLTLGA